MESKPTRQEIIDILLANPDCTADAMLSKFTQHFGKVERGSEVDKALSPTYELAKMYFAYSLDKIREQEVAELKAKCERLEALLRSSRMALQLKGYDGVLIKRINEALSGEGEKEPTEEEKFNKWDKENATQLGESHWLIGYKHIHSKSDLIMVYNRFKKEDKQ